MNTFCAPRSEPSPQDTLRKETAGDSSSQETQYCSSLETPFILALVCACVLSCFSHAWLFAIPWTVAPQAPLSMGFPSKNTGVGCHSLLQGTFLTQGSNPDLLHCRRILYCLSHQGSPGHFGEMLKEFKPTLKNNLEDQAWLFFFKSFVQLVRSLPSSNDNLAFYFLLLSLCISSSPMFL